MLASRHVLRTVTFAGHDRWSSRCRTFNQSPTPDKTSVDSPPAKAAPRYGSLNKTTDTTEQIVWWLESLKILSLYSCCWYSFYLQLLNLSIITNNLNAKLRMRSTFMNTMRSVLFVVLNSLFFHQAIKISYYQKNNL